MTTKGEAAAGYAKKLQWAVFPLHWIGADGRCSCNKPDCKSPGKHPLTADGFKSATRDEEVIGRWWAEYPDANIGIPTGRRNDLVVVDLDSAKGGKESDLQALVKGDQLQTITIRTGGGKHFYYRCPVGAEIRNSTGRLGFSIDVRGEGGYVVAPPSDHVSGKRYEIISDDLFREFPQALIDKLESFDTPVQSDGLVIPAPKELLRIPQLVAEGSRNDALARVAGKLRDVGLTQYELESTLEKINERVCSPPLAPDEVRAVARSISRYETDELTEIVGEDEDAERSALNTLTPYRFGQFRETVFERKEILGFHIGRRDVAMLSGATNAGKSTFIRNAAISLAAGRPFEPVIPGHRPIKCLYIDFETDAEDLQPDLLTMSDALTRTEMERLDSNLIVLPKGLVNGELFALNRHWDYAAQLIKYNGVELIFVDNVSSAFDLNDENSNAEVTRKVIKPLLKLAYSSQCATVFIHHFGKGSDGDDVYAGRGASAFQSLSKTVMNLKGDTSKGEDTQLICTKRKTEGGGQYNQIFSLNTATRWFERSTTTVAAVPRRSDPDRDIRDYVRSHVYPMTVSTSEICDRFEAEVPTRTIKRILTDLTSMGLIHKPRHGHYCDVMEEK